MAEEGSWEAIRSRGLWCTRSLLEDYKVSKSDYAKLYSERRPSCVELKLAGLPNAVVRDQLPMTDAKLANCLQDGLTPSEWYEILNSKTFFWLSRSRIWSLLQARAYRNRKQTVLTLDTGSLVEAHYKNIWLSPINSGATLFKAQPRGRATFKRIEKFPFDERKRTRPLASNVVELVVDQGVADISKHVLAVHEVRGKNILREIWRSPRAGGNDHP